MAATYDYLTRKITRDFHFVKGDTKCTGSGLPTWTGGHHDRCRKCQYYLGTLYGWTLRTDDGFVMCKHPDKKDDEDSGKAQRLYYDKLEQEALAALCY